MGPVPGWRESWLEPDLALLAWTETLTSTHKQTDRQSKTELQKKMSEALALELSP